MTTYCNLRMADSLQLSRRFVHEGLAIEPVLKKGVGEMTKLILHNEQQIISCTTQQFLHQLCKDQFFDFKSLREQSKKVTDKKQLVPVPLTFGKVIFPLRNITDSQIKMNGFLWISHRHVQLIDSLLDSPQHSIITLTNGELITVPYKTPFLKQQVRDCYLLEHFFQEAHRILPSPPYSPTASNSVQLEEWHHQLMTIAEVIRNYPDDTLKS